MSTEKANINTNNGSMGRFAKLAQLGDQVFHVGDLANLWNINNKNTLYTTLKRYSRAQLLFRVQKGMYAIKPITKIDPYLLGIKALHKFAYVSTESILSQAGIILQDVKYITLISSESKKFSIGNMNYCLNYRSRQLDDKFLFQSEGLYIKNGIYMATTERAIADILYFCPNFHFDNRDNIDWKKVKKIQTIYYDFTK
jgi:predicted transcriptional regulator of viral defense system